MMDNGRYLYVDFEAGRHIDRETRLGSYIWNWEWERYLLLLEIGYVRSSLSG